ncbi:MAG TPA: TonB-dependent receptor [Dysgonomonas sp.]|uniref:SusC/RagA family TonB-linked outer membrane protein n=1 Tax=unclassified Dysgonomonas TaxID=2630389 RepID=UPI0025BCDD13|nr:MULTISPECIES: TonB-dependent receptor [unclassified Dysgonomonas]HML64036.1 TonB-dependent receptor [Dysgonomonas sp.]
MTRFFRQTSCICLRRVYLMLIISLLSVAGLYAQSVRGISGTVTSDGEPLIGASVVEKGTTNGTLTDVDGKFTLSVKENATIEVSYIGFTSKTFAVGQQTVFNVELKEEANVLNEVVAIGYGVQKKKLNTGATLQVKGDEVAKLNTTNPLQALQGQAPGVQISSTSGQPGADMKVTIRGLGTIANSGPLYIIDGIEGDISVLNAADIQSIDVLKDAASAAIYGAQAANGVILVTTKQGSKGKGQVSFDAYYGVQKVARKAKMLNANEYMAIMNEQALNSGSALFDFDSMGTLANTNWINQMFKDDAKTENYSLNVNGGSEASRYALSLNYTSQEGVVGGKDVSNYERYGFRINTEHKLYKEILTVGQHLNFNYIKNRGINVGNQYNNTLRGAFITSPLSPVYSDNNIYDSPYNDTSNSPWYKGDSNPYGLMMTNSNNKNDSQRLMADVYAELEPVKNLKLRSVFGINYYASEYRSFEPFYQFSIYTYNKDHTTTLQNMSKGHTLTWTNTAGYDFTLADDHAINALVGMEATRYQGTFLSGSNRDLLSQFNDFSHAYLDNTTGQAHLDSDGNVVETRSVGGRPEHDYRRVSYFGRVGYNYKEKYMFNATLRADGSSKFAKGNRWGYFPSFSAGWVITNEDFMQSVVESRTLDFLKLRLSWGQVGNQNIDDDQYLAPINTSTAYTSSDPAAYYNFGTNKTNVAGAYQSRLSNQSVKWETSEQLNIGFDAYMLRNRLGINADFYTKKTKDWLVVAPILATAGAGAPYINGGDVKNTGIELGLTWRDNIGQVNYNIGVNGSYDKNKVGNIPTDDGIIHGLTGMLYDNSEEFYRAQNGYSIGYFWGYKTAGVFQSEEDIEAWKAAGNGILQADVKPGDVKYVDRDKNGKIDATDKTDLGNGMPDFSFGFNLGFEYKGFDFNLNANGVMGNKIVQSYRNHTNKQSNYTTAILNRWTGEGTSNKIPRVTETNINWQFSDLYLQDGDFLRISNISIGYDFAKLINLKCISQCRLYASVQNAFTFTKYDGMDPEIGYGTSNWVSGIDLGYYPRPRTYLFGVNLKF